MHTPHRGDMSTFCQPERPTATQHHPPRRPPPAPPSLSRPLAFAVSMGGCGVNMHLTHQALFLISEQGKDEAALVPADVAAPEQRLVHVAHRGRRRHLLHLMIMTDDSHSTTVRALASSTNLPPALMAWSTRSRLGGVRGAYPTLDYYPHLKGMNHSWNKYNSLMTSAADGRAVGGKACGAF